MKIDFIRGRLLPVKAAGKWRPLLGNLSATSWLSTKKIEQSDSELKSRLALAKIPHGKPSAFFQRNVSFSPLNEKDNHSDYQQPGAKDDRLGRRSGLRHSILLRRTLVGLTLFTASRRAPADVDSNAASEESTASGAESSAHEEHSAAPQLEPPKLLHLVEAPYPPEALAARQGGQVVLRLTIDAEGAVTDAEVTKPVGHGFDEAARSAATEFRFSPAKRNGVATSSRILYAYDFLPPDPPPEETLESLPSETLEPSPPPPQTESEESLEVVVQGQSDAERLRQSAQAVLVVETEEAKRETADLGEVLARTQGVGVRRGGGLGSNTRFSLNGLTDDQIRFFLDGIPLEFSGYPFGIANVPVNLVERIEVYRGVVPIHFGADALGGAVNLVTDEDVEGTHGSASYQAGSFGTHRAAASIRTLDEPTGIFTRANAFFDYSDNDYLIDVEVPDDSGQLSPARVYRFHDAYRATGVNVETGVVNKSWAKRLLLRGFITDYEKELQNNVVMTVPYGEVKYGELATGATLRYENVFAHRYTVEAVGGYAYSVTHFLDVAECVYNWFGQCVRERRQPGEIDSEPRDQLLWDHNVYGRVNLGWLIEEEHALRFSLSPTYTTRTGDERRQSNPESRDPLTAERDLVTLVSGLEYQADLLDQRLENIAFLKDYFQVARSEEPLPGGIFRDRDRDTHRIGLGDALRYRFFDWLYAKTSYEWATRLPRPDEVFGDGVLVVANLELEPEVSHNVNLGLTVDASETDSGAWRGDINGFLREAEQLIVLLGNERVYAYQNVFGARSIGVEGAAGWTSPGEYIALDANATYLDFRNTSSEGTFGDFEGDRIPNRPYLFANGTARFQLRQVAAANDELALTWNTRYVHEFFRGWESVGLRSSKEVIPSQFLHSLALTYLVTGDPMVLSFTGEVDNLTDQPAFDFFGVQRPGRAVYFKTTAEF